AGAGGTTRAGADVDPRSVPASGGGAFAVSAGTASTGRPSLAATTTATVAPAAPSPAVATIRASRDRRAGGELRAPVADDSVVGARAAGWAIGCAVTTGGDTAISSPIAIASSSAVEKRRAGSFSRQRSTS